MSGTVRQENAGQIYPMPFTHHRFVLRHMRHKVQQKRGISIFDQPRPFQDEIFAEIVDGLLS